MFYLVKALATLGAFFIAAGAYHAHEHSQQSFFAQEDVQQVHSTFSGPTWAEKYGTQFDQSFSGPLSFSHLPYFRCLENEAASFDIAVIGLPFDTAVTYRPGYLYLIRRPDWQSSSQFFSGLELVLVLLLSAQGVAGSAKLGDTHFLGQIILLNLATKL